MMRPFSIDVVGVRTSGCWPSWKGVVCNLRVKTGDRRLCRGLHVKRLTCCAGCKVDVGDGLLSVSSGYRHKWPFHGDDAVRLVFHDWCDVGTQFNSASSSLKT